MLSVKEHLLFWFLIVIVSSPGFRGNKEWNVCNSDILMMHGGNM